jgi:hypothetical protein
MRIFFFLNYGKVQYTHTQTFANKHLRTKYIPQALLLFSFSNVGGNDGLVATARLLLATNVNDNDRKRNHDEHGNERLGQEIGPDFAPNGNAVAKAHNFHANNGHDEGFLIVNIAIVNDKGRGQDGFKENDNGPIPKESSKLRVHAVLGFGTFVKEIGHGHHLVEIKRERDVVMMSIIQELCR